ncbi:MAG: hypothetical protein H7317_08555, partial [Pseudorhodobacter sp.]|nr:hypothetical protein [Pseudorhodobacter sp.]
MTRATSRHLVPLAFVIAIAAALPAAADAVSDALHAALDAYDTGNLAKTGESLTLAMQELGARQSAMLATLLPAAPAGWTATPTTDFALGFGIMGGGAGAEMRYDNADRSQSFTLSFIADNPVVASMGAMLGSAQMMAMMGKVAKVGDQPLLETDNSLSALVNSRVLFQAQGAATDVMMA